MTLSTLSRAISRKQSFTKDDRDRYYDLSPSDGLLPLQVSRESLFVTTSHLYHTFTLKREITRQSIASRLSLDVNQAYIEIPPQSSRTVLANTGGAVHHAA